MPKNYQDFDKISGVEMAERTDRRAALCGDNKRRVTEAVMHLADAQRELLKIANSPDRFVRQAATANAIYRTGAAMMELQVALSNGKGEIPDAKETNDQM